MTRASSLVLVLAVGCGPLVPVDEGTGEESGSRGADGNGDDRPGTGPQPTTATMTAPEGGPADDGDGDGEVDEGWKPDFAGGVECDEFALASCYSAVVLAVPGEALQLVVDDVVGNEWPDLVVVSEYAVFVYPGEGGSWSDPLGSPTMYGAPIGAGVGDSTGDGHKDLVVIEESSTTMSFATGDGAGFFYPLSSVELPFPPLHLRVRDIDGNGLHEPIAGLEDGFVAIVHDIASPMPVPQISDSDIWVTRSFEVGSLGLGGAADDLMLAGDQGDQVVLAIADYEQAVDDHWIVTPFADDPVGLVARDFDGDGLQDIATATMSSGPKAFVYPGVGPGMFLMARSVALDASATAIAGGRFGPGVEGLAAIVDGTPTVVDFEGNLATPLTDERVRGPLAVGDYNGDGIDDIVAATADGIGILVLWSGA